MVPSTVKLLNSTDSEKRGKKNHNEGTKRWEEPAQCQHQTKRCLEFHKEVLVTMLGSPEHVRDFVTWKTGAEGAGRLEEL